MVALDRAQHPLDRRLVHQEQGQADVVRVDVEQVAARLHGHLRDAADGACADQLPRAQPRRVVRALVGDRQLDAVARAGGEHAVRLAQVHGHRLLADDRPWPPGGGGDHHLGVLGVPGADVDEVGALGVQHLAVVGVAVLGADAEELPELAQGVRVAVGDGRDAGRPAGHAQPGAGVDAGDHAARDDGSSVTGHDALPIIQPQSCTRAIIPHAMIAVRYWLMAGRSYDGHGRGGAGTRAYSPRAA